MDLTNSSRFDPQWSGFRRVKNVFMQLEWARSLHGRQVFSGLKAYQYCLKPGRRIAKTAKSPQVRSQDFWSMCYSMCLGFGQEPFAAGQA